MTPLSEIRRRFDRRSTLRRVTWALLGLVLVAAALSVVGPDLILEALASADRGVVVGVAGLLLAVLVLRGLVLWVTLRAVGAPVGVVRGVFAYLVVALVNTVVPGGGAGGAPVAGLVVARAGRTDYEVGVTAALTVTALSNLMVGTFGVLGMLSLVLTGGADGAFALGWLGVGLFLLGVGLLVGLWRFRDRMGGAAVSAVVAGFAALDRRLPWAMPDRETVERHAETFVTAAERIVAGSPAQSVALLGLAATAHLLSVLALLLALAALDITVHLGLLFMVIPTAVLAAVAPVPGAGGGVEFALVGLLSATTDHPVAAISAAVLIYRGIGYGLRVGLGGLAAVVLALFR